MKKLQALSGVLFITSLFGVPEISAQNVAINATGAAPAASAMLDISSVTTGLLIPRMSTAQRTAIAAPATGLLVYDTGGAGAFYWYDGTTWRMILGSNSGWLLTGNALAGTEFMGSTNAQPVMFYSNNTERMRILSGGQVLVNHTAAVSVNPAFESQGTVTFPDAMRAYTSVNTGIGIWGNNTAANAGVAGFGGFFTSNQTGASALAASLGATSYYAGASISAYTVNTTVGGRGVLADCDNATGIGVQGQSSGASGVGVYGFNSGATGFGMVAANGNATGTGLITTGNNVAGTYLVNGSGAAMVGTVDGAFIRNTSLGVSEAIYTNNGGTICRVNYWNGITQYKINGTGTVSTTVQDVNGQDRIMHCPETPEFYYMDYGQGQLVNGRAHIELDPNLAKNITVNEKHPLRAYVQLEGDCNGVYITNKTSTGFDVVELKGGTSNVAFQWNVVGNAADQLLVNGKTSKFADLRFEKAEPAKEEVTIPADRFQFKEVQTMKTESPRN